MLSGKILRVNLGANHRANGVEKSDFDANPIFRSEISQIYNHFPPGQIHMTRAEYFMNHGQLRTVGAARPI
jgi:hypothetical protein